MREILYQGKRIDNKEWVEGFAFLSGDRALILTEWTSFGFLKYSVYPASIRQFIGETDSEGRKVFTDDILCDEFGKKGVVIFLKGAYAIDFGGGQKLQYVHEGICKKSKIVGNIHDNPGYSFKTITHR